MYYFKTLGEQILFYVEIKCQLVATDDFYSDLIACSTCFGHHYARHQELRSIIQVVVPVVFCALVFKLSVSCGAEGHVSGLRAAAAPNITGSNYLYNTLELLMMGIKVPETC
jgi:hypothetical protein